MRNEVTEFLDTRYVAAPEACWRLFGFPLHGRSHVVERLPVHLPMEHQIRFMTGKEKIAVEEGMKKATKLKAWFSLNEAEYNEAIKRHEQGNEVRERATAGAASFRGRALAKSVAAKASLKIHRPNTEGTAGRGR